MAGDRWCGDQEIGKINGNELRRTQRNDPEECHCNIN
jgi:hypothetical protein